MRIWDSVTLNTLHVIGTGFFDRAVTCIAFSKSVSPSLEGAVLCPQGAGGRLRARGERQRTGHCPAVCTGVTLKPSDFPGPLSQRSPFQPDLSSHAGVLMAGGSAACCLLVP